MKNVSPRWGFSNVGESNEDRRPYRWRYKHFAPLGLHFPKVDRPPPLGKAP